MRQMLESGWGPVTPEVAEPPGGAEPPVRTGADQRRSRGLHGCPIPKTTGTRLLLGKNLRRSDSGWGTPAITPFSETGSNSRDSAIPVRVLDILIGKSRPFQTSGMEWRLALGEGGLLRRIHAVWGLSRGTDRAHMIE